MLSWWLRYCMLASQLATTAPSYFVNNLHNIADTAPVFDSISLSVHPAVGGIMLKSYALYRLSPLMISKT